MPNTILTADEIATIGAKLVGADLGLSNLFSRDVAADFGGGKGETIRVRVPGAVPSRERAADDTTTPLAVDTISEQSISVELSTLAYSNVAISVADAELNLVDFAKQVLYPQTRSVTRKVETEAAAALLATPATTLAYTAATPAKLFTQLRKTLRDRGVDAESKIVAVVGSSVYADILDAPVGSGFDSNGTTVRGIEIHESSRVPADNVVAFVKEAFSLVVRAPEPPAGAPYAASVRAEGDSPFALTHIQAFDVATGSDRSIVEALVAVAPMPLAVDRENGVVELVPHGGAVRVDTAA
ncbi:P22 phage major capsid protein family protein [Agromyces allii]|uniref:Major capsid protein n=1 Tax=Agromyces allii TaxID=393607 RepID=A0ABP5BQT5_9MICO|nr:P22 phage major capsid protein family protein [Agromyces allii]